MSNEYKEKLDALKLAMAMKLADVGGTIEFKEEVDRLTDKLIDVISHHDFKTPQPDMQILMMNRAAGFLHNVVTQWFAESAANFTIHKEKLLEDTLKENRELLIKYDNLKDLHADTMLGLREVAVLSINPKDRAKNWNTKKSKDNFKKFVKGEIKAIVKKKGTANGRKPKDSGSVKGNKLRRDSKGSGGKGSSKRS